MIEHYNIYIFFYIKGIAHTKFYHIVKNVNDLLSMESIFLLNILLNLEDLNLLLCYKDNKQHTGLEQHEGEQKMTELSFLVNYPFKS